MHFHSDGSNTEWGYKFTVTADGIDNTINPADASAFCSPSPAVAVYILELFFGLDPHRTLSHHEELWRASLAFVRVATNVWRKKVLWLLNTMLREASALEHVPIETPVKAAAAEAEEADPVEAAASECADSTFDIGAAAESPTAETETQEGLNEEVPPGDSSSTPSKLPWAQILDGALQMLSHERKKCGEVDESDGLIDLVLQAMHNCGEQESSSHSELHWIKPLFETVSVMHSMHTPSGVPQWLLAEVWSEYIDLQFEASRGVSVSNGGARVSSSAHGTHTVLGHTPVKSGVKVWTFAVEASREVRRSSGKVLSLCGVRVLIYECQVCVGVTTKQWWKANEQSWMVDLSCAAVMDSNGNILCEMDGADTTGLSTDNVKVEVKVDADLGSIEFTIQDKTCLISDLNMGSIEELYPVVQLHGRHQAVVMDPPELTRSSSFLGLCEVTVESQHPCSAESSPMQHVFIEGASALQVSFDAQSSCRHGEIVAISSDEESRHVYRDIHKGLQRLFFWEQSRVGEQFPASSLNCLEPGVSWQLEWLVMSVRECGTNRATTGVTIGASSLSHWLARWLSHCLLHVCIAVCLIVCLTVCIAVCLTVCLTSVSLSVSVTISVTISLSIPGPDVQISNQGLTATRLDDQSPDWGVQLVDARLTSGTHQIDVLVEAQGNEDYTYIGVVQPQWNLTTHMCATGAWSMRYVALLALGMLASLSLCSASLLLCSLALAVLASLLLCSPRFI